VIKFCTATPNICGPSVGNPCQLSGIQNGEVSDRFLEKLRTSNIYVCTYLCIYIYMCIYVYKCICMCVCIYISIQ
jgi:hypothetical protein